MKHIEDELVRAMKLVNEITEPWAQIFLKSGQVMWVRAAQWEVLSVVEQEATDGEDMAMPLVSGNQVVLFDGDGECVSEDIYLPFDQIACIRIHTPFEGGGDQDAEE